MIPVKESRNWRFGPVCLYIDDVKRIVELVEKHYRKPSVIIGKHCLENTAELDKVAAMEPEVYNFEVSAYPEKRGEGAWVYLVLKPDSAYMLVDDDSDTVGMGVATQIVSVLSRRRRRLKGLVVSWAMWVLVPWLVMFPLVATGALLWVGAFGWAVVASLVFGMSIILCYYAYLASAKQYCVIVLKPAAEVEGFFARHREQLIMNLITAVLGGIVGVVLGRISCEKIVERPVARNEGGQLPAITGKEVPSGTSKDKAPATGADKPVGVPGP